MKVCSNNADCMDTPYPILSPEAFDALVAQESMRGAPENAVPPVAGIADPLRQALAWALELSAQVITNMVSRATLSIDRQLVSMPGTPQAELLEQAAVAMDAERVQWARQYTALLRMAIAYPAPAKMAAIMPQVDLRICAQESAQLDTLVAQEGSCRINPLGAQSYVQALLELLSRSSASAAHKQIWADHLLAALSSQLAWVYLQLQAVLRDPASREASVLSQADGFDDYAAVAFGLTQDSEAQSPEDIESGVNTQTQALAEQARKTVVRLRSHLGMPIETEAAMAQALSGNTMENLLHDLDQAEQLMALIRERGLPMPAMEEDSSMGSQTFPATMNAPASTIAATITATLAAPLANTPEQIDKQVAELMKAYQNTTTPSLQRVPVPLREAMDDLREPLLHLAQQDPQFFSADQHPARQFLELITQRSLRFSSEMADGFQAFMGPVDKIIEAFALKRQVPLRNFEQANNSLKSLWQRQDDVQAQAQARQQEEKEQAQAAKQLAGRLAFELVGRRDAGDAPPMIKQFLMGPWAQVLARAQLFPEHASDSERYTKTLAALLWSVSLRRAAPRKNEHADLLPKLMLSLKEGLLSIKLPDVQIDGFVSDIKKLQDAVQAAVVSADADVAISDPAPLL
jgi:Protein of unknown function (DUF1631)